MNRPLMSRNGSRGELFIYDQITPPIFGGISAKLVTAELAKLKGVSGLDIRIASKGGDVFEGLAIYEALKRFPAEKVVYVDSEAVSAASFVAMAGDHIITAPQGTWLVHEGRVEAAGRARDLAAMVDLLTIKNKDIANIYAARTGNSVQKIEKLMAAETVMSAQQALDLGFTDEIAREPQRATAALDASPVASSAPTFEALIAETQRRISAPRLALARMSMDVLTLRRASTASAAPRASTGK